MSELVGSHPVSTITTPSNGDPLDANVVRNNDNTIRAAYVSHDADPGIHVQSSDLANRPVAGVAGRKWMTTDTGSVKLWYDNGSSWEEIAYVPAGGAATFTDLTVTNTLTVSGDVASDLTPNSDGLLDLGSPSQRFGEIHVVGGSLNGVQYAFPAAQGATDTFLRNDGSGNLTWQTAGGGALVPTPINPGAALYDITLADANRELIFTGNGGGELRFLTANTNAIPVGTEIRVRTTQSPVFLRQPVTVSTFGPVAADFNPNINGAVRSAVVQDDGRVVIVGEFTQVNGVTRNRIARLNVDGTLDTTYDPNANNTVTQAVLLTTGQVAIIGFFTTVSGSASNQAAIINSDGSLGPVVTGLSSAGSASNALLAGPNGTFYAIHNASVLRRMLSTGAQDTTFSDANISNIAPFDLRLSLDTDGDVWMFGLGDSTNQAMIPLGSVTEPVWAVVRVLGIGSATGDRRRIDQRILPNVFGNPTQTNVRAVVRMIDGRLLVLGNFNEVSRGTLLINVQPNATIFDKQLYPTGQGVLTALLPQSNQIFARRLSNNTIAASDNSGQCFLVSPVATSGGQMFGNFNSTVRGVAEAPDRNRLYLFGDFTAINITTGRTRIAAFDALVDMISMPFGETIPPFSAVRLRKTAVGRWVAIESTSASSIGGM